MNREGLRKHWKALAAGLVLTITGCANPDTPDESPVQHEPFIQHTHPDTGADQDNNGKDEPKLRPRFKSYKRADGSIQGAQAIFDYPGATRREVDRMEHCGNDTDKILLTFDDKGSPEHIAKISQVLRSKGVGAIFFPNFGPVSQDTIDTLRGQGFYVGNHTATHPNLVPMSDRQIIRAVKSGGEATLVRPPYGGTYARNGEVYFDGDVKRVIESPELGDRDVCLWTIDTKDWTGISASDIKKRVYKKLAKGSVILMHAQNEYNTLEALPGLIDGIRKRGYELCAPSPVPTTAQVPSKLHC